MANHSQQQNHQAEVWPVDQFAICVLFILTAFLIPFFSTYSHIGTPAKQCVEYAADGNCKGEVVCSGFSDERMPLPPVVCLFLDCVYDPALIIDLLDACVFNLLCS